MMNRLLFLLLTLMIVNNPMMQAQPVDRGQKGQNDVALKTTPLKAYQWGAHSMTIRNQGTESILWNFESTEDVDAWTTIDRDGDGYNWGLCTDNGLSGQNSMVSESYLSGMGPFNPDNLLVSPQVTLSGTLSMYAQNYSSYFSDRFAVYVCVGELAQDLSNMEKISGDLIPDTHWTKYTFDLESYAGETGCIVIRHYDSFDMYWLYIDDISITYDDTPPTPERTEMPVITTEETDNGVWVTATGQGHICLYVDDLLVAEGEGYITYEIAASDEEEEYTLLAYAQIDGMEPSDWVALTVIVPPRVLIELPAPVINYTLNEETVVFTAVGEGIISLHISYYDYWTGDFMYEDIAMGEGEVTYEIPRGDEYMLVSVWAVSEADGAYPGMTETEYYDIPAMEMPPITPCPVIICEMIENGVHIIVTGEGFVCLYIDDMLVAEGDGTVEYVITCSDSEEMYILTATAQAEGMQISEYVYYELVVPAMPYVVRGDADGDGKVTVNDVTALVDYLLSHDPSNINLEGADFNLDGSVSVSDVTAIVDFILGGAL